MSITAFCRFSEYRWVYRSDRKTLPQLRVRSTAAGVSGPDAGDPKVAKKLDKAFPDVSRTGMFFEGFGVDHVHSKLSPMHGTGDLTHWKPIESRQNKFFEQYEGYLSSHDHERADDENWPRWRPEFVRHNMEHFCRMAV